MVLTYYAKHGIMYSIVYERCLGGADTVSTFGAGGYKWMHN